MEELVATPRHTHVSGLLTIRGSIFLATGLFGLLLAYQWNDLISSVLAPTLLILVAIAMLGTLLLARRLQRSFSVSIALQPGSDGRLLGGVVTPGTLQVRSISGSPSLWDLVVQPRWRANSGDLPRLVSVMPPVQVTRLNNAAEDGAVKDGTVEDGNAQIRTHALFPHRGVYVCEQAECIVQDPLGLTARRVIIPTEHVGQEFCVEPVQVLYPWPVISSVERAGDTVQLSQERLGARLDLKTYHPADGMRAIAWKIFARRGELLARTPEAAATPDGTVALLVCAPTRRDDTAGAAVAYARRVAELSSELFAAVVGDSHRSLCRSADALLDSVIQSALSADEQASRLVDSLAHFLDAVSARERHSNVRHLALVLPSELNTVWATGLQACALELSRRNIAVTALIVPTKTATSDRPGEGTINNAQIPLFKKILFDAGLLERSGQRELRKPVEDLVSTSELCATLGFAFHLGQDPHTLRREMVHAG